MIKRQYEDNKMECAFENAIDCLVYGYGKMFGIVTIYQKMIKLKFGIKQKIF